ncbi:MAG: HAD family phosphatase [Gammaproteobacteria bacterium]|nr:HAD family phosphatase [Gammaproteobacteria bacterium]
MKEPRERPRAIVFDMDGLLLDTERQALEGFLHACRANDITPHLPTYYRCIGTRSRDSRQLMIDGHGPEFPFDDVVAAWGDYYAANFKHRPPPVKSGAREILEVVRGAGLACALATSTHDPAATERLAAVGLDGYFDVKVTGDRITRGKPDPEIYRTAAAELGVEPVRAWALEDSPNGVRAAIAAEYSVIQVPDLVEPDARVRALGHVILPSLEAAARVLRDALRNGP